MKYYFTSFLLIVSLYTFSQNKNLGIGLQSNFPTKGLSLRLDLDSINQIQLSYSSFKDYSLNRNLYGWKYSRIINKFKYFQSYSYVGFMIMSYNQLGIPTNYGNQKNGTTFSYGLGMGIQNTLFHFSVRIFQRTKKPMLICRNRFKLFQKGKSLSQF